MNYRQANRCLMNSSPVLWNGHLWRVTGLNQLKKTVKLVGWRMGDIHSQYDDVPIKDVKE